MTVLFAKKILAATALPALLPALLAALLISSAASAACTDTPAPGVDWKRCSLDNRHFQDANLAGANLRSAFFARSDFSGADLSAIASTGRA